MFNLNSENVKSRLETGVEKHVKLHLWGEKMSFSYVQSDWVKI